MSKLPTVVNPSSRALEKLSPFQLYLSEIAKYPLLSPEEEYEFAVKHFEEQDISAAHRLVTANLRLVVKIANDFHNAHTNVLDLIQEGNAGLMQAVKKYNPYRGVKLSSYAAWWIRAYILKYIMENRGQVKIATTAAQRKLFFNLKREAEKLLAEYDKIDTKLLAENLAVREKDVIEMQKRLSASEVSLDAPLLGESKENYRLEKALSLAKNEELADDRLANEQLKNLFHEHLQEFKQLLKGRDLEIFNSRVLSETPLTLQEVGDRYGVTRERARQIEARLIQKLKDFVQAKGVIDLPPTS